MTFPFIKNALESKWSALNNSQHADFIGELVLIGYPESPETVF
tara:strand:+ start:42 stop:170 length:129 start_codon:yes stop_codon:yes gene_type:complete